MSLKRIIVVVILLVIAPWATARAGARGFRARLCSSGSCVRTSPASSRERAVCCACCAIRSSPGATRFNHFATSPTLQLQPEPIT